MPHELHSSFYSRHRKHSQALRPGLSISTGVEESGPVCKSVHHIEIQKKSNEPWQLLRFILVCLFYF
jgi:hypothetical protein